MQIIGAQQAAFVNTMKKNLTANSYSSIDVGRAARLVSQIEMNIPEYAEAITSNLKSAELSIL